MRFYNIYIVLFVLIFTSCKSTYTVLNKGVAGHNSAQLLERVEQDVVHESPDLVLIMVGTNDMINSKKFLSFEQYFNNLKSITNVIDKNTKAEIVLMSILPVDEDYVFKRHDRSLFNVLPNQKIDSLNNVIKQFASVNNYQFIDVNSIFRNDSLTFKEDISLLINSKNYTVDDGVHPTAAGYKLMAQYIFDQLKGLGLLSGHMRIVCFGDSITYGAFMEGKGTANEGDTYPSTLNRLLNKI